jgi:hypothetical protein
MEIWPSVRLFAFESRVTDAEHPGRVTTRSVVTRKGAQRSTGKEQPVILLCPYDYIQI